MAFTNGHDVAVVTGASSGIGAGFAQRLAARGMNLVVVARRRKRLEQLSATVQRQYGVQVEVLEADLSDRQSLGGVVDHIGGIAQLSFLVNSAGYGKGGAFAQADPARIENELYLDVIAVALLTRAALPAMIARRSGSIINVSSSGGFNPSPNFATYSAAKAAVIRLTEAVSHEVKASGVRMQVLCPGPVPTEFNLVALGADTMPLPGALVQSVDDCVDASLRALEKGKISYIPHFNTRMLTRFIERLPLSWRLGILASASSTTSKAGA